jgi:hypothetical protein
MSMHGKRCLNEKISKLILFLYYKLMFQLNRVADQLSLTFAFPLSNFRANRLGGQMDA